MNPIYDLAADVFNGMSAAYRAKMHHAIPKASVVERERFLISRARDKVVLDIGCTGPLSRAIERRAREYHGVDRVENPGIENYTMLDLDLAPYALNATPPVDLVLASEVIEHLANPGSFLDALRGMWCPVIVTAPNAFGAVAQRYVSRGVESVNPEHVCWYSWHTLKVLVERCGFRVAEWYWYNGKPLTAEGLIFCLE